MSKFGATPSYTFILNVKVFAASDQEHGVHSFTSKVSVLLRHQDVNEKMIEVRIVLLGLQNVLCY